MGVPALDTEGGPAGEHVEVSVAAGASKYQAAVGRAMQPHPYAAHREASRALESMYAYGRYRRPGMPAIDASSLPAGVRLSLLLLGCEVNNIGHRLFQGLKSFSTFTGGNTPLKVMARSSRLTLAGGFVVGHSSFAKTTAASSRPSLFWR